MLEVAIQAINNEIKRADGILTRIGNRTSNIERSMNAMKKIPDKALFENIKIMEEDIADKRLIIFEWERWKEYLEDELLVISKIKRMPMNEIDNRNLPIEPIAFPRRFTQKIDPFREDYETTRPE